MKTLNYYILNPAYYLRNDISRIVLGTFDFPNLNNIMYDRNFFSFIHPVHAQMLSLFDGSRTLSQCVEEISKLFSLSNERVLNIVSIYINNEPFQTEYNGNIFSFPKNVLIEKKEYTRVECYDVSNFIIEGIELDYTTVRLNRPVKLILETNTNCMTNCEYCYVDKLNPKASIVMPWETMESVIKQAYSDGIPSIELNGGEVLMYEYIDNLLDCLNRYGYHPFISTKVPVLYHRLVWLREHGFVNIQISIDTLDIEELSRRLCVDGSSYLSEIIRTMDDLDRLSFDWQVNVVITKGNSDLGKHIKPLMCKLLEYNHLKSIKLASVGRPMYKCLGSFENLKPSLEDLYKINEYVKELSETTNVNIIFDLPSQNCHIRKQDYAEFDCRNKCTANQLGMVILPNGDVTICEELYWNSHFIIGSVVNDSILDIWSSAKSLFYISQNEVSLQSPCSNCSNFKECRYKKGVCWKNVIMAYGHDNWDFPDPACPKSPKYTYNIGY